MYKEDRPYEKCEKFGAENLTDTELLAILIRTGTKGENSLELSRKLLYKNGFHNGLAGIHKWSLDELIQIKGIGKVKAIQLVCLSELSASDIPSLRTFTICYSFRSLLFILRHIIYIMQIPHFCQYRFSFKGNQNRRCFFFF